MNKNPFFSVVIPTYNCANLLNDAIKSILEQTFSNYEILVIDNHSTDNTNDVLKRYDKYHLRIFKVNNGGVIGKSRNIGIKNSKGKWIAFLDSDDSWYPDKLEIIKNEIEKQSKSILICHDEWYVVNGKKEKVLRHGPSYKNMYEKLIFDGNKVSTSATCVRTDIAVKSGGFSEKKEYVTVEDYEYWVRLSTMGSFHFINKTLGEWNIHKNNFTNNIDIHTDAYIVLKKYFFKNWLKKYPKSKFKVSLGYSNTYYVAARNYYKINLIEKVKNYLFLSLYYNPLKLKSWILLFFVLFKIKNK